MRYDIEVKVSQFDEDRDVVAKTGTEMRTCELSEREILKVLNQIRKFLEALPETCVDPAECSA